MRKRNFIKSFLYYSAIIAIPILTVFLVFLAFVFQAKQREIREDAETAAQAVRDNYSLVLDSAATSTTSWPGIPGCPSPCVDLSPISRLAIWT